jgi:hypothetical protein
VAKEREAQRIAEIEAELRKLGEVVVKGFTRLQTEYLALGESALFDEFKRQSVAALEASNPVARKAAELGAQSSSAVAVALAALHSTVEAVKNLVPALAARAGDDEAQRIAKEQLKSISEIWPSRFIAVTTTLDTVNENVIEPLAKELKGRSRASIDSSQRSPTLSHCSSTR